jgi:uncharacterized protein
MKHILRVIAYIIIFIAGIRYIENRSIYYPMKEITTTPSEFNLYYEDVYFNSQDNKRLHAWFIPSQGAEFTILFNHGNAGNISHRLDKISMLHAIGFNVFIYDYRGYGKSLGSPSETGLYKDIEGAYNYLREMGVSHDKIVLYGESIGGAIAIELAYRRPVGGIITENTFTSVKDMVKKAFPLMPYFIFSSRFDSLSKIEHIKCKKLIIHSVDDEIVPFTQGERLFNAAIQPKEFLELRGGHNTAFWDSLTAYKEGITSFASSLE